MSAGNSDDKLTQGQWASYYSEVFRVVDEFAEIHFSGIPAGTAPWQNACLVCAVGEMSLVDLREQLQVIRKRYRQDSLAGHKA